MPRPAAEPPPPVFVPGAFGIALFRAGRLALEARLAGPRLTDSDLGPQFRVDSESDSESEARSQLGGGRRGDSMYVRPLQGWRPPHIILA